MKRATETYSWQYLLLNSFSRKMHIEYFHQVVSGVFWERLAVFRNINFKRKYLTFGKFTSSLNKRWKIIFIKFTADVNDLLKSIKCYVYVSSIVFRRPKKIYDKSINFFFLILYIHSYVYLEYIFENMIWCGSDCRFICENCDSHCNHSVWILLNSLWVFIGMFIYVR